MKKTVISLVLVIILLSAFPLMAFAENTCRDDSLCISFTVPDGWTRFEEAEKGRIKYAFSKDASEEGTYFVYSVFDMYSNADEKTQAQVKRSDVNNSTITIEEFKEIMGGELGSNEGISDLVIDTAEVDGKSFFKLNFTQSYESGSNERVVVYCHIYDGYMTYYRYETFESVLDEEEAQAIVSTVVFENEKSANKTQTNSQKIAKNIGTEIGKGVGMRLLRRAIIAIGVVLAGGVFAGIGAKKRKKKGAQPAGDYTAADYNPIPTEIKAPTEETQVPTDENNEQ